MTAQEEASSGKLRAFHAEARDFALWVWQGPKW